MKGKTEYYWQTDIISPCWQISNNFGELKACWNSTKNKTLARSLLCLISTLAGTNIGVWTKTMVACWFPYLRF